MEKTAIKIAIGSDHAGYKLKEVFINYLQKQNFEIKNFGCYSEERADYPDYGHAVAKSIETKETNFGILICGSGNGINITANKHKGIRAALCWNKEIAELARLHNDANILTLPGRFIEEEEAIKCVDVFFSTNFEGGRHQERINKINVV